MSTTQPKPQTPEEDDAYYRAVLHDLIDRGADLARRIHERAAAPAPDSDDTSDPSIPFDRLARTIRRTIALARHIAANPAAARDPAASRRDPPNRAVARQKIIRGIEDAIDVKCRTEPRTDAEALDAELNERLEDPALEFDLINRPIDEIIEEIARDLGVARQSRAYIWRRRKPRDVADLRARANAPPGPPFHLIEGGKPPRPPKTASIP